MRGCLSCYSQLWYRWTMKDLGGILELVRCEDAHDLCYLSSIP